MKNSVQYKGKVIEFYEYNKDLISMKGYLIEIEKKNLSSMIGFSINTPKRYLIKVDMENTKNKLPVSIRHGQFIYSDPIPPVYKLTKNNVDTLLEQTNPIYQELVPLIQTLIKEYEKTNQKGNCIDLPSYEHSFEKEIDDLIIEKTEIEDEFEKD